ncbi:MAG: hypothetical protein WAQ05_04025 [Rubrivivax sp.]
MNLRQMTNLKRWFVAHSDEAPLELHTWDAVVTLWLLAIMGVPPLLLLHLQWAVPLCLPLFFAPPGYVALRQRLHRRGTLRCDWLPALG